VLKRYDHQVKLTSPRHTLAEKRSRHMTMEMLNVKSRLHVTLARCPCHLDPGFLNSAFYKNLVEEVIK
jgi:hypothetical protein